MKPIRTLVLVADDENARFLLNEGIGKGLTETTVLAAGQFEDASSGPDDRPGRSGGTGPGGVGHALDPRETRNEHNRRRFAQHVARTLDDVWREVSPDRLVIAAPAKMLGILRNAIPSALASALVADLSKDLVKIPTRDLPKHFADIAAF